MNHLVAIAAGGALGALARYGTGQIALVLLPRAFPFGTLIVNVAGSLLIGVVYALTVRRGGGAFAWNAIAIGFLGAYTTFSTFALDNVHLIENGRPFVALGYTMASVVLCIVAAWLGTLLVHR